MIQVVTVNDEAVVYPDHRVLCIRRQGHRQWQLTIRSLLDPSSTETMTIQAWRRVSENEWL